MSTDISSSVKDAEFLRLDRRHTELDNAIRLLQEIRLLMGRAPKAAAIGSKAEAPCNKAEPT
jgi:hypothetical protein